jgi:anti-anti-sigma factor
MAELEGNQVAQVVIDTTVDPSGAPVIAVSGELDISNADSLKSAVDSVTARRPDRLIFDLNGLRFMDSAGIAVLIGATAEVGAVQLRNPSEIIKRVVELTGLSRVLPIEP